MTKKRMMKKKKIKKEGVGRMYSLRIEHTPDE
jgi:hypothetical protein